MGEPGATVPPERPIIWMGQSRRDVKRFPSAVRYEFGFALYQAQCGSRHTSAKVMKGFAGGSVLEVVEDDDGSTYRCVYTVRFAEAVYVLHAFQKKSTRGIATSKHDIELIQQRLREAKRIHEDMVP